jgi:hypothetical protein
MVPRPALMAVPICLAALGCGGTIQVGNDGGGDMTSGFSSDDGGPADPVECEGDCKGAATIGCDVDNLAAQLECEALCAKSPTQGQLDCLQATPCSTFVSALEGHTAFCGISAIDAGVAEFATCETACNSAVSLLFLDNCYSNMCEADMACMTRCSQAPSPSQVACFHDISCANLLDALDGGPICGDK